MPHENILLTLEIPPKGIRNFGMKLDIALSLEDSKEFIKGKITKFLNETAGTLLFSIDYVITYKN